MSAKVRWAAVAVASVAVLAVSQPAEAVTVSLTPANQSIVSGGTATWGGAWGDYAPYSVTFYYGDGASTSFTTNSTSRGFSHNFYSCTGATFTQHLHVKDGTGTTADAYSHTSVARGNHCNS